MAESAAFFLLGKLTNILLEEVRAEVQYIKDELERFEAILGRADALEDRDPEHKLWVKQVRDVAHDMDDAPDEFTLPLAHDHGYGYHSTLQKFASNIKTLRARHRIAPDIQEIKSRVETISKERRSMSEPGSSSSNSLAPRLDSHGDTVFVAVGNHESQKLLLEWTIRHAISKKLAFTYDIENKKPKKIIPIFEMGGLWKTTLAKQDYEDPKVKKHFIVLDDAWRVGAWDAVKYALPSNNYGSGVILTTRHKEVASSSCTDLQGKVYNLDILPQQEACSLFRRKTCHGNSCPPHLEEFCRRNVKRCGGLPVY